MIESLQFDKLCNSILNLNKNIQSVEVISKFGRTMEKVTCNGFTKKIPHHTNEMLLMQCVLQISMGRDFDDNFGTINYYILKRENLNMITFPLIDNIVLVTANKNTSSITLARKIVNILENYRNEFINDKNTQAY